MTPAFLSHVADNVRRYRLRAGLSQKALADASGVSLRMIGGIERGGTSVSTATLDRIGLALHATLADLVREPGSASMNNAINRLGWEGPKGGQGVLLSSVSANREVETWEWLLQPGERYQAGADPSGWHVLIVVVEGTLTLELASGAMTVSAGCHLFDSSQEHRFANRGRVPTRFFRSTVC